MYEFTDGTAAFDGNEGSGKLSVHCVCMCDRFLTTGLSANWGFRSRISERTCHCTVYDTVAGDYYCLKCREISFHLINCGYWLLATLSFLYLKGFQSLCSYTTVQNYYGIIRQICRSHFWSMYFESTLVRVPFLERNGMDTALIIHENDSLLFLFSNLPTVWFAILKYAAPWGNYEGDVFIWKELLLQCALQAGSSFSTMESATRWLFH